MPRGKQGSGRKRDAQVPCEKEHMGKAGENHGCQKPDAQPGCEHLPAQGTSPGRKAIPPRVTAQATGFVTRVSSARTIGENH